MRIKGKAVIVTGASSGIGLATAERLARAGANVVLVSDEAEKLAAIAHNLAHFPGRRLAMPADVTREDEVQNLVARAVAELGRVDVLVNNAGLGLDATIAEGTIENMRRILDVNLFGYIRCIQAVVPQMRQQGEGVIVNVSSVSARIPTPYNGVYGASKAAISAVSDALRLELERDRIRVLTIYPGYTRTRFFANSLSEIELPKPSRLLRSAQPEVVARKLVQGLRQERREVYVTFRDSFGVLVKAFAPRVVDWGVRRLWLGGGKPRTLRS